MFHRVRLPAVIAVSVLATACSEASDPLTPDPGPRLEQAARTPDAEPRQASSFDFVAAYALDGSLRSEGIVDFGEAGKGRLLIQMLSARTLRNGRIDVEQLWTIYPPDPGVPFDVRLRGSVRGSEVRLRGEAPDYGAAAVTAILVEDELRGSIDIVGFNPQPEPPALPGGGRGG